MADEKIQESPPTTQTIEELHDPKKTGDAFGTEVEPEEVEPVVTPRTWAVVFVSERFAIHISRRPGV